MGCQAVFGILRIDNDKRQWWETNPMWTINVTKSWPLFFLQLFEITSEIFPHIRGHSVR